MAFEEYKYYNLTNSNLKKFNYAFYKYFLLNGGLGTLIVIKALQITNVKKLFFSGSGSVDRSYQYLPNNASRYISLIWSNGRTKDLNYG